MQQIKSKKAFKLLVRQRELKAIHDLFSQVSQYNEAKKRRWLKENSELVTDAFMSFLEMNKDEMSGVNLNDEAGQISLEIMDLLDKTTDAMESAFNPKTKLEV